ncbi:MAG: SDR family oxidoreductase, partial [Solirubrobacteraceae bacterium]
MTYFVTGATGFIGRNLVERLLEREGTIHVLVREGSTEKLGRWGGEDRIVKVVGDLTEPKLGVTEAQIADLKGSVDHFFHLAAVYDMTADDEQNAT